MYKLQNLGKYELERFKTELFMNLCVVYMLRLYCFYFQNKEHYILMF